VKVDKNGQKIFVNASGSEIKGEHI